MAGERRHTGRPGPALLASCCHRAVVLLLCTVRAVVRRGVVAVAVYEQHSHGPSHCTVAPELLCTCAPVQRQPTLDGWQRSAGRSERRSELPLRPFPLPSRSRPAAFASADAASLHHGAADAASGSARSGPARCIKRTEICYPGRHLSASLLLNDPDRLMRTLNEIHATINGQHQSESKLQSSVTVGI